MLYLKVEKRLLFVIYLFVILFVIVICHLTVNANLKRVVRVQQSLTLKANSVSMMTLA